MNVFIERLDLPIDEEWSRFLSPLLLVVDDVCVGFHQCLEFLLAAGDGKAATVGALNAKNRSIDAIDHPCIHLGDLLRVELSHREQQPTGVASLLARYQGLNALTGQAVSPA